MNEIRHIIVTLEHSIALRISEEVQQNELTNSLFFPASQVFNVRKYSWKSYGSPASFLIF